MPSRKRAKEGEEFYFCNGTIARSVAECRKQLERLSHDEFVYHVNDAKNDFYNWINSCLDPKLAQKIKDVRSQNEMIELLKGEAT